MKVKHWGLIFFSGMVWLVMGVSLLMRGLRLIVESVNVPEDSYLLQIFQGYFSNIRSAASCLIAVGIIVGYVKGRYILKKTVARVVERIVSLESPVRFYQIYSPKFYLLIAVMISLSVLMRVLSVSADVRGTIDLAVGSALMNGAFLYFRSATFIKART